MNIPSKNLEELVEHFSSLPGIGKKTALRLVLNLLKREEEELQNFASALGEIKSKISACKTCGNITDADECEICTNHSRRRNTICVVEDIRDIMALESTQQYFGLYHVLGGVISPMDGIGPADLNIDKLLERAQKEEVTEIILALSASMEGDTTNFYLYRKLADFPVEVTTLSRGVAVGTELHYVDELTLGRSIVNRMPFDMNLTRK
ncbi:MAG: recombination mediator RecR [Crocinitomicaceae bacterium]|nr:recombination mediator RecR [Crocinitomicaceae bacterium]